MKVIIVDTSEEMGVCACDIVAADMAAKTPYVLGLATGSTPLSLYAEFVKRNGAGNMDFSTVITFNLDEYVGVEPTHDQSYRYFMNANLFDRVNINKRNTFVPDGMADSPEAFGELYEEMIEGVGGVDLQVLGIGSNGHIGFNEPGSSLASMTRQVKLTRSTIKDNSRMFEKVGDVPTHAITMGIGTILNARKVILLATGANKVEAVARSIEGPITATVPASALQLHPDVTFILTKDAAAGLKLEW